MNDLWATQKKGVSETLEGLSQGWKKVCVTSPTGGGKTRIMGEIAYHYLSQEAKVVLYTNRTMLLEQTSNVFGGFGLDHGVRAPGHEDRRELNFQISSIQTEGSRVLRRKVWNLHDADLVLIDEAHQQTGDVTQKILRQHLEAGAAYVGFTATPIDLGNIYDHLVVAGTTSELRACGALVPCLHYGPDEPDLKHIGKVPLGQDLSEKQNRKAIMVPGIFGRVLEWFRKLNPDHKPTILFAPGVKESVWFAEQFEAAGISAAHIDGENVWVGGELVPSSRAIREEILSGSKSGDIKVVCNRFVLREGIDAPWLCHGIFATVFGALQSMLQSGGRLLRNDGKKGHVTLQDHGGNWWRHGSLNADRQWRLGETASMVSGLREERLRQKKDREPFRCPQCAKILSSMSCPCGFQVTAGKKSRPVVQSDGTLKPMSGDIYRPRRVTRIPNAAQVWERMYHRSIKAGRTFRQAEALFAQENNWGWPPRDLPLMPTNELDWFRKVSEVPRERLTK